VDKLDRYLPDIDEARVEITQEKTKSVKDRNVVQITLRSHGDILGPKNALRPFMPPLMRWWTKFTGR
jgi:ribosome-associated translation inhibitor RaiA